jgi:hypothetical protein
MRLAVRNANANNHGGSSVRHVVLNVALAAQG